MPETTLTPKSVRIAEDEAKWLSTASAKGGVTQNDLLRLALNRLRKELGAANRVKPEAVIATAKATKYKLTPPRTPATTTIPRSRPTVSGSPITKATPGNSGGRGRTGRSRGA